MTIFIAGSGLLGRALKDFLINSSNNSVILLSLQKLSLDQINNELLQIGENDTFVDSMDPNAITNNVSKEHLKKIEIIRTKVLGISSNFHYIFLSTASIYPHNLKLIDEKNITLKKFQSKYLEMKFKNETLVNSLSRSKPTIARLVSVWSDENQDSFFGDLIKSFKEKKNIPPREGDDTVISYINLIDACKLLNFIILNRKVGTINICTNQYDSRSNMKAIVNNKKTKSISNLYGLRIYSSKLDWEKIITERKELF